MKTIKSIAFAAIFTLSAALPSSAQTSAKEIWRQLSEGNARFASGKSQHPHQDPLRRAAVAEGQKPIAVVIGCADSRVAPEIIFDQGLGDLFVVRLAGNIVDDAALGSVEFAVGQLGARLIVVLGHEKCGAVKAAVEIANGKPAPAGSLGSVLAAIRPAAEEAKSHAGDPVDEAVKENVRLVAARLTTASPLLESLTHSSELQVLGARYDLEDGTVTSLQ